MGSEEIKRRYVEIIEEIDKTLIESNLKIKQVQEEIEEIQRKTRKNIHELSLLL